MSDNGTSRQAVMETPLRRSIFDHLGDGVAVVDQEGQITQVNPAATRILGADIGNRTLQECLETLDCFEEDQATQYVAERLPLSRALQGHHVADELMFVRHPGRPDGMWLCVTATPVLDDNGQPVGAVAVFRDVTLQREAQWRVARLNAELEQRVEERTKDLQQANRELHLTQATYADLYNFAPDMFFSIDASTGAILECNQLAVRKLGYTREELLGRLISEIVDPGSRDVSHRTLAEFRETTAINEEMRFLCKDGTAIDISLNTSAIRDEQGRIIASRSICRDITQRKQVEQELQANRERLQDLIDDIDAVVWERDAATLKFTFISPRVEDMLGYARERWLTEEKFWVKILHPDDREFALTCRLRNAKLGLDHELEYRVRMADGRDVWLRDIVRAVKDAESGQVTHLRGVFVDVTSQKEAELALRRSEEYFRQLVDTLPEMLWMAGLDKQCTFFNKQWLDFSGRTMEQELGNGWAEGIHPDDLHRYLHEYTTSFDARAIFSIEYRLRRHDGEFRWIANTGIPWFAADGEFAGYVGSCVDVTDRLLAEEQVRKQRRELTFVARVTTMGEMTAGLAHEVNQPLSAIASYSEGLKIRATAGQVDSETLIDVMQKVGASAERAGDIIGRLRKLIRKREASSEPVDVNEQIHEVVQFTDRDAYHAETEVQLNLLQELPKATGDSIELQQVLVNLIRNGIDAMSTTDPKQRKLRIDSRVAAGGVCVTVSDAGPGIPQKQLPRLFDAFYTTKEDGLGMGLAISRSIVESHGGRIWATSPEQGGAQFHFTLPVARGDHSRD